MMNTMDILDFHEHSKRCFVDELKSSTLTRVTKNTLKGECELKDGSVHILTVTKKSKTFAIYNHKVKKG